MGLLHMDRIPDPALQFMQVWLLLILFVIGMLLLLTCGRTPGFPGFKARLFSLLGFSFFFLAGCLSCLVSRPVDPGLPLGKKILIRGELTEGPGPGSNSWSYAMKTDMLCVGDSAFALRTHLKVHLRSSYPPDSLARLPRPGETWILYGQLFAIRSSGNPGSPDYKAIMSRKDCWYRFYSDLPVSPKQDGIVCGRRVSTRKRVSASRFRRAVSSRWIGNEAEVSLLKAVCLGDRSDLSNDLKQAYSHAGAMHLLAVSGLHLGLIWWVLYHLFFWMTRLSGKEIYRSLVLIFLLWVFAFVSGFSSSVCRSACMFSLFTAGRLMDQRMQALNSILVSAFLLILIRPQIMLHVGFQLSYAAILGIVCLFPVLRNLLRIKNRLLRRLWEASLVSFSAQVFTAPLVIYYFHQIPVYSIFTSLITIPLLSVLISLFVISVPFMLIGVGTTFFNYLLVKLAGLMNFLVEVMASLPGAVLGELTLDAAKLCLWMGMLIAGMIWLHHRKHLLSYLVLILLCLNLCSSSLTRYRYMRSSEMQISHFYKSTMLSFREGLQVDHYCWYRDSTSFSYMRSYIAERWNRRRFQSRIMLPMEGDESKGAVSACRQVTPGVWLVGNDPNKGWLISGSGALELARPVQANFVLLSGSPELWNLPTGLLEVVDEVILDGSNPEWYSIHLEQFRADNSLSFKDYWTHEQGAYLKRW
jgi:ComEC/Rec2-related protein